MADAAVPASLSGERRLQRQVGAVRDVLTRPGSADVVPAPCPEARRYAANVSCGFWPKMIGFPDSTWRALLRSR